MAKISSFDYFNFFENMICCGYRSAELLKAVLNGYDHELLETYCAQMHEIERQADQYKHEMMKHLFKEFLPPIDREDIVNIAHLLDEVCDSIEDVVLFMYINDIRTCRTDILEIGDIICEMCAKLQDMICKFRSFKKNASLFQYVIDVNALEEKGDSFYISAMRRLATDGTELRDLVLWQTIYARTEFCCDACERVADALEEVILKNT